MATKTKNQFKFIDENPIEKHLGTGGFVDKVASTITEEAQRDVNLLWKQLLGVTKDMSEADMESQVKGDLREGEAVVFSKKEARAERKIEAEPGIDYRAEIIHGETRIRRDEERVLSQRIEEVVIELKKLAKSSKELEVTFSDITVQTLPEAPGTYHLNFFEWVLSALQNARMRIEESAVWVNVVSSKKAKKDYWNLAKKHGTSFSLSGERIVATQTG